MFEMIVVGNVFVKVLNGNVIVTLVLTVWGFFPSQVLL